MRTALCGIALLMFTWPVAGQTGGLAPEWEARKDITTLATHVEALKPILAKVTPKQWQNAPAAYADQGKRVDAELDYLLTTGQALADRPDKLTVALNTYFRMQSLELMLRSYAEGIRKYQNPALAELLLSAVATASVDREKLHQYIMDLAADKETQLRLMDQEAQRCRGQLSRVPNTAPRNPDRTTKEVKK